MFTQPCFIRKNTPELRKKLEELGYYRHSSYVDNGQYLYLNRGFYHTSVVGYSEEIERMIDCGKNEDLFLALAALRDDTDKNQWLTDGKIWGKFDEDSFLHPIQIINYLQSKGHKATVEEIIEHFKDK
mgnify:CR=1 FL=1